MLSKYLRIVGMKTFIKSWIMFPFYIFYREVFFIPKLREEARLSGMSGMDFEAYCNHRFSNKAPDLDISDDIYDV